MVNRLMVVMHGRMMVMAVLGLEVMMVMMAMVDSYHWVHRGRRFR